MPTLPRMTEMRPVGAFGRTYGYWEAGGGWKYERDTAGALFDSPRFPKFEMTHPSFGTLTGTVHGPCQALSTDPELVEFCLALPGHGSMDPSHPDIEGIVQRFMPPGHRILNPPAWTGVSYYWETESTPLAETALGQLLGAFVDVLGLGRRRR